MGKRIILNLRDVNLKGDILDVGESFGVIYNLSKDLIGELAVDFVCDEEQELNYESYDVCTMFFNLSSIFSNGSRQKLIDDVSKYLKPNGDLYIWDINKEAKEIIRNDITAILPSGKMKDFEFKNLNPLSKSSIDNNEKLLEKNFKIEETKLWEDIHYIKAKKTF